MTQTTELSKDELIAEAENLFLAYDEPSLELGTIGLLYRAVELLKVSHAKS